MLAQTIQYQVPNTVYYKRIGDDVFLRDVATRCDYIFNLIVADILDTFQNPETIDEAVAALIERYEVKDPAVFKAEIEKFVNLLCEKKVLHKIVNSAQADTKQEHMVVFTPLRNNCISKHILLSAVFELTYRCNERCIHCYLDNPVEKQASHELTLSQWIRTIDEFADMGCANVLVTGGEPTLYPDFLEICRHIVKRRMLLDIFTNALEMRTDVFDALCQLKPNSISFSLYGASPNFHDSITQIPGSFEKSLKNILMFTCAGIDTYVKTLLFKGHFDEYLALRKMTSRLHLGLTAGTFLLDSHLKNKREALMQTDEEYRQYLLLQKEGRLPTDKKLYRDINSFICTAGRSSLNIRPNGDVVPCGTVPLVLGNVRQIGIREIWEGSKKLRDFYQLKFVDIDPHCATCHYSSHCSLCLGNAYNPATGKVSKNDYTCRHAKLRHDVDCAG